MAPDASNVAMPIPMIPTAEDLRIASLREHAILGTEREDRFDRIAKLAAGYFEAPIALVSLIDEQRQWFKACIGLDVGETPRDWAFCDHAINLAPGSVMVVENALADARFNTNPLVLGAPAIRFYAGAVLTTSDGHNLGTLCVIDTEPRPRPSEADIDYLRSLAQLVVDQLELSKARSILDEQNRLLRTAEAMSGVGHWRFDLVAQKVIWSDEVFRIHGLPVSQAVPDYEAIQKLYHEDDRQTLTRFVANAVETGEGYDFGLRIRRPDGEIRHVIARAECSADASGKTTSLFGVFQDVTAQHLAAACVAESERHYRLLADNVSDVIALYGADGIFRYVSPSVTDLLGYAPDDLIGKTPFAFMHPDDHARVAEAFRAASAAGDGRTIEYRALTKAGEARWLEARPKFHWDRAGKLLEISDSVRDVTARVTAKRALEDSETRFRRLAESAPIGIFRADADGNVTYVNREWVAKVGLSFEESLGNGWMRALADPTPFIERPAWIGFVPGEVRVRQSKFKRAQGGEMWVETVNSAEFDDQGSLTGFIGAVIDITEQRQSQIDLAESKRLFETLASLSPAGIFRTDSSGNCTYVNDAWLKLSGLVEAEAFGSGWASAIHPDDRDRLFGDWIGAVEQRIGLRSEFRFQHCDGRTCWVEVISEPEIDEHGSLVGYIGVNIDITQRKLAEKALGEREEQLSLLAANATDAVFRLSLDGTCIYASPSVARLLGVDPAGLIGRNMLTRFHPEDAARVNAQYKRLATGDEDQLIVAYRAEPIDRPGIWVWLEANSGLVRDPATGLPSEIIVSVRDISERKRLELDLERALAAAEGAAEAKTSFLANMSHEIRTPMNGVLGFTELLLADSLTPDQRRKVELIADSGTAMMRLLNDILDLTKIEAGQLVIFHDVVDLPHLVGACIKLMAPLALGKSLPITFSMADGVPSNIIGDGLRLRQIILNLLGNAIKFTTVGSITIRAEVQGAMLSLSVEDTGIGIDEDRQAAVMGKFVQAEDGTARRFGGSGLGLSTELAQLMGGTLTLNSTKAVGTTLTLALPLRVAEDQARIARTADQAKQSDAASSDLGLHILVAEDHEINQHLVKAMLARLGCKTTIAPNGAVAVAAVDEMIRSGEAFDLVLMDMQMPTLNGVDATQRIRAAGVDAAMLPIVALTANAYESDIEMCRKAGMQDHLSKPITIDALRAVIQKYRRAPGPAPGDAAPFRVSSALAKKFADRTDRLIARIETVVAVGDLDPQTADELQDELHKLAGSAGFFDDDGMGEIAAEFAETLARLPVPEKLAFLSAGMTRLRRSNPAFW